MPRPTAWMVQAGSSLQNGCHVRLAALPSRSCVVRLREREGLTPRCTPIYAWTAFFPTPIAHLPRDQSTANQGYREALGVQQSPFLDFQDCRGTRFLRRLHARKEW